METTVRIYEKPQLRSPVMICGLPGIGSVAWLAANHIVKELKAEFFGEILSPTFSPKVWLADDGTVKLTKGDLHFWKNSKPEHDLIIFTANEQPYSPEGQYTLAEKVLEVGQEFQLHRLITMGGMATEKFAERPKVYGGATEADLVKELETYGVLKLAGGAITGTNGLLFGLAKPRKIPAVCLLSETPGYLSFDANAARAALEVICKMLGIELDMAILERQAKENVETMQKAREVSRAFAPQEPRKPGADRELSYVS